jgi:hypothetical protein
MEEKVIDMPIVAQKPTGLLPQAVFTIAAEARVWKGLLGALGAIRNEVKLEIGNNEMTCAAVDPAHVMMVNMKLDKQMFTNWDVHDTGPIGINVKRMLETIKHTRDDEQIAITTIKNPQRKLREGKDYSLDLQIDTADITRYRTLEDITGITQPKVPNLHLRFSAKIDYRKLQRTMNLLNADFELVDHITIRGDMNQLDLMMLEHDFRDEKAFLYSTKTFYGGKDCVIEITQEDIHKLPITESRSLYPMDYMMDILGKGQLTPHKLGNGKNPLFETVTFEFGSDYPLRITMHGANMKLMYLMAPRIENE